MSFFDKAWSPYAAGVIIGLLLGPALLIAGTGLDASALFFLAGSALFRPAESGAIAPTAADWAWPLALAAGILLGAFLSARLSGSVRQPISPIWRRALGTSSPAVRYLVAFCAGFVMLFGTLLASGGLLLNGLVGVAELAAGSLFAIAGVFAGSMASALLLLRRI